MNESSDIQVEVLLSDCQDCVWVSWTLLSVSDSFIATPHIVSIPSKLLRANHANVRLENVAPAGYERATFDLRLTFSGPSPNGESFSVGFLAPRTGEINARDLEIFKLRFTRALFLALAGSRQTGQQPKNRLQTLAWQRLFSGKHKSSRIKYVAVAIAVCFGLALLSVGVIKSGNSTKLVNTAPTRALPSQVQFQPAAPQLPDMWGDLPGRRQSLKSLAGLGLDTGNASASNTAGLAP